MRIYIGHSLLALIFLLTLSGHSLAQAVDKQDIENLSSKSITFYIGKREFQIEFTDDALSKTPDWDPESQAIPLTYEKAIQTGRVTLKKDVGDDKTWKVIEINCERMGNKKWIYVVKFRNTVDRSNAKEGDVYICVVKMDGSVFPAEITFLKSN